MNKITICHLYYDLMNLYGEIGNIKALKKNLEAQDLKVEVLNLSLNDILDFKYDIIYIGSGTNKMRDLVIDDLVKYKEEFKNFILNGGFVLATGNAYPLFGKYIIDNEENKKEALNIFDFSEDKKERTVSEATFPSFLKTNVYGFLNHYHKTNVVKPLFDNEGHKEYNFYGTYLIGPILIRNPKFLTHFIKEFLKFKGLEFKSLDLSLEEEAYKKFIEFKKEKMDKKLYLKKYKNNI